jgi:hypothetical protein
MADNRSLNPFVLIIGFIAGAAGALLMSDPKTRKKAGTALNNAKKKGTTAAGSLFEELKKVAAEAEVLNNQKGLDKNKKKTVKSKK